MNNYTMMISTDSQCYLYNPAKKYKTGSNDESMGNNEYIHGWNPGFELTSTVPGSEPIPQIQVLGHFTDWKRSLKQFLNVICK